MGAVFASAARAPLTSVASVLEMTGDFTLTLPVMLAVAIATATSRALSYGTIYTTKLLRRGQDIDRAAPWRAVGDLKAADVMRPFPVPVAVPASHDNGGDTRADLAQLPGHVIYAGDPQVVCAAESLAHTLRQLKACGRDGLPVLSADGHHVQGWITSQSVVQAVADRIGGSPPAGQQRCRHDGVPCWARHAAARLPRPRGLGWTGLPRRRPGSAQRALAARQYPHRRPTAGQPARPRSGSHPRRR